MGRKRRMAVFLTAFVVCLGMPYTPGFAAETETPADAPAEMISGEEAAADDTYQYIFHDNEHWSISPHLTSVKYSDGSSDTMFPDLFLLDTVGEEVADARTDVAAYCCDIRTGIETNKQYRRVNLEDSTYFDDDTAARIRGVITNGYWHDWEDDDIANAEAAVNQWLAAQGKNGTVHGLTRAEALTATQAAIWHVAENMESDADITAFQPYARTVYMPQWDPDELVIDPRVDIHEAASENTKSNIELLYGYLLQQPAKAADTVLFTDEHFLLDQVASQKDGSVTLRFRLAGTVGEQDALKLAASLGDRSPLEYLLTGNGKIAPDDEGYYTITFDDVTEEEWKSAIRMSIWGSQMMNGVCFYEAKPADGSNARETSQNLIGKVSALTAVYAEAVLELAELPVEEIPEEPVPEQPTEPEDGEPAGESEEAATIGTTTDRTGKPAEVQTGDDTDMVPWVAVAMCAALAATLVLMMERIERRKKGSEETA